MRDRNGKPTAFQLDALKSLGFNGKVKTYRDAENTIKRLRRNAAVTKKTVTKPACTKSCTKKCAAKPNPTPCKKHAVAKWNDKADTPLSCKKDIDGICVTRIVLPPKIAALAKAKLDQLCGCTTPCAENQAAKLFLAMENFFSNLIG